MQTIGINYSYILLFLLEGYICIIANFSDTIDAGLTNELPEIIIRIA